MAPNPFLSSGKPDSGSEQIVQAKPVALDEAVLKAYGVYERFNFPYFEYAKHVINNELEKQVLLHSQINELLQLMISETEPKKLNSSTTGLYLTRLIQDSYDAGYNNFVLTTGKTGIDCIAYGLYGAGERIINLRIEGNVGDMFGKDAKCNKISILGKVGNGCGNWAKYSKFIISGYAGDWLGYCAEHSEFIISLDVGIYCANRAKQVKVNTYGQVSLWCGESAEETLFITHTEHTFNYVKKYLKKHAGNVVRLVDTSGKVLKEEDIWF